MKLTVHDFVGLLAQADAVTVDGGPLLSQWETSPITGEDDNEVAAFFWTDGDYDYGYKLTEGVIRAGYFREDNAFVMSDNTEGDTELRFFTLTPLVPNL